MNQCRRDRNLAHLVVLQVLIQTGRLREVAGFPRFLLEVRAGHLASRLMVGQVVLQAGHRAAHRVALKVEQVVREEGLLLEVAGFPRLPREVQAEYPANRLVVRLAALRP